jgi:hypothetical protein
MAYCAPSFNDVEYGPKIWVKARHSVPFFRQNDESLLFVGGKVLFMLTVIHPEF